MKTSSTRWLAALAATLSMAGSAWAAGDSFDCDKGTVNASGTESAHASSMKHVRSMSKHAMHVARDTTTLHAAFPQCADKTDRSARAECVSAAWEARQARTSVASNSSRRPC
jgi:hypothetical protein